MSIILRITNAGRAALVNAQRDGTNAVRVASVGVSPNALVASPVATTLPGEVKRIATISGGATAADVIHVTVRDESTDTYTMRSFALYLADGTLFAIYGQNDPIIEKSAAALLLLAIDATLVDVSAANVTFGDSNFMNPAATTETAGVVELATVAEARAGGDATRALTPATGKASLIDWLGYTPANRAGDTFTGPIAVRHAGLNLGLTIAQIGTGYGFIQLGEAAETARNWHVGSGGDGRLVCYQGSWGSGIERFVVASASITFNGGAVWHAGNDGAGSGLDADLLDGLQASQFVRSDLSSSVSPNVSIDFSNTAFGGSLRLGGNGYTVNGQRASVVATDGTLHFDAAANLPIHLNYYSGSGVNFGNGASGVVASIGRTGVLQAAELRAPIVKRSGLDLFGPDNDGAGSGLDADLLDGRHASDFALLTGATFSGDLALAGTVVLRSAPYPKSYLQLNDGVQGIRLMTEGGLILGAGSGQIQVINSSLNFNGGAVWHAGNDGAGSGLDADLLDGLQASQFVRSDVSSTLTPNVALDFSNTAFGGSLRLGGNGYTANGLRASIVATNGTLHFDASADLPIHLNYYSGSGVNFGNGASGVVASISKTGVLQAAELRATIVKRNGLDLFGPDNDGAGSGMDADLLDGRDGAWYGDIPGRLGYTPANRAGDTFTGPVAIRHAALSLGLTIAQAGTGYGFLQLGESAEAARNWHVGSSGDGRLVWYQGSWGGGGERFALTATSISFNGAAIWNASNDGAGSGLDADLLDGWHRDDIRRWGNLLDLPASFAPSAHSHGAADLAPAFASRLFASDGYQVLPGGLILQWCTGGMVSSGVESATNLLFPIAFPNACLQATVSTQLDFSTTAGDAFYQIAGTPSTTGVVVQRQYTGGGRDERPSAPRVFAIGY